MYLLGKNLVVSVRRRRKGDGAKKINGEFSGLVMKVRERSGEGKGVERSEQEERREGHGEGGEEVRTRKN